MKKGFTLIELLVVVLIIGILASIALPQYTTAVEKARAAEALALMGTMRYAGERYRLQTGKWPANDFDSLDIEVPGTTCGSDKCTKNFKLHAEGNGSTATDNWTITATRISDPSAGTAAAGELNYVLTTEVTPAGTATRSCTNASDTSNKMCKAISSGNTGSF